MEGLGNDASANVGKDFSLNKIKNVTAELKKSNYKSDKAVVIGDNPLKEDTSAETSSSHKELVSAVPQNDTSQSDIADETAAEIGDELLADLLDKDLLKGHQKPKKDGKS